jgi:hypothetical protein
LARDDRIGTDRAVSVSGEVQDNSKDNSKDNWKGACHDVGRNA